MSILSDLDLKNYIREGKLKVDPLSEGSIRENGLDLRIGGEIARLNKTGEVFELGKTRVEDFYELEKVNSFIIQPHEHLLVHTLEYLALPNNLVGFVNLRSTFARLGLLTCPTVIDAGFEGQLTIELVGGEFPVKLEAGKRILHVVFAEVASPVQKPYSGKYRKQTGIRLPTA